MKLNNLKFFFQLLLSPDAPYFRISTSGIAGECHIEIPHDTDSIENFQCKAEATFCYQYSSLKPAMKALSCANKVSIKTDNRGLLVFQFMIKTDDGHLSYIEYYVNYLLPLSTFYLKYLSTYILQLSPVFDADE